MTEHVRYLTHPEVAIDPSVPVPSWGLSATGRARAGALARQPWLSRTRQIVSSGERKALETAAPIADALGIDVEVREAMHENDRSATGFLPPAEFEAVADAFFAAPEASIRGWERAIDAQKRIAREVDAVLARPAEGDVLFIGHGGVGTLLLCSLMRTGISRRHDQPGGGGHYFTFTKADRRILHPWRRMEIPPAPGEIDGAGAIGR
jgi:broad specificity phosphatase PhoE